MKHRIDEHSERIHLTDNITKEIQILFYRTDGTLSKKASIEEYRRKLGMPHAVSNICGKICVFMDATINFIGVNMRRNKIL